MRLLHCLLRQIKSELGSLLKPLFFYFFLYPQLVSVIVWNFLKSTFEEKVWIRSKPTKNFLISVQKLRQVFCKKGVLGNFVKFTGKHLCQSLFFAKFLRTPFLIEHLWATASERSIISCRKNPFLKEKIIRFHAFRIALFHPWRSTSTSSKNIYVKNWDIDFVKKTRMKKVIFL